MIRWILIATVAGCICWIPAVTQVVAQSDLQLNPPVIARPASVPTDARPTEEQTRVFNRIITQIVLDSMPHTFEDKRDWGKTAERWDGLHIQMDGLKVKTKRRKKVVNHGTWKMYTAQLTDPREEFQISVDNIQPSGDGRVSFDVSFIARMRVMGRLAEWVKGVQLFSLSAHANAKVRLRLRCLLAIRLDLTKLPPDVLFVPEAKQANVELMEFEVYRISKAGGELAQQLGRGARKILEEKIKEKEHKLVIKINRSIEKRQDKFRLSLHDVMKSKWGELIQPHLPAQGGEAPADKS